MAKFRVTHSGQSWEEFEIEAESEEEAKEIAEQGIFNGDLTPVKEGGCDWVLEAESIEEGE